MQGSNMLQDGLSACKSWKGKALLVNDFYQSRRIDSSLEPMWIHGAYEIVKNYIDDTLQKDQIKFFYDIIRSHELPDGFEVPSMPNVPSSPIRIMHEGWKIGSPTWIFMGRNQLGASVHVSGDWIAVKRTIPSEIYKLFDPQLPDTIWMAYNTKIQMGSMNSSQDVGEMGPAMDFEDLVEAIEKKIFPK
jgi:hypothetical protein